jgi:hypothetical protein
VATAPVDRGVRVDLRCPTNPTQLFARLMLADDGKVVGIEVSCRDCRRKALPHMHYYALDGSEIPFRHEAGMR